MKKHLIVAGKAIAFFILWGATLPIMMIPSIEEPAFLNANTAFLRLWWELLPLISILLVTGIFVLLIERNKIKVPILNNLKKNIVMGFILGFLWLGAVVMFFILIGVFTFGDTNNVSFLPIWFVAVLLNVIMQNCLVRGYLFSLFKEKYNVIVAVIITTILFTALHGGAFEAGIIAVLNVATMSIFVSLLLIYTGGLIAPIIAHFVWNSLGRLILGVVSMADDYPNLFNISLSGSTLISGGAYMIEGSIVVLVMNILLIGFVTFLLCRQSKQSHSIKGKMGEASPASLEACDPL